ncbi:MAG: chemotaxis response regulator protein-glutamate methylesterase [Deltaproteobacteria bacterium]|nr:chemotaxis response regulator protein-glutamate methylesterase [Deltaproteobacteria bacterium]
MPKIKVLIVDDSATVRQTLVEVLASDPGIEVIATAADPFIAVQRMKVQAPDVIILDIEMPRMDGLTFLDRIMSQHPIPVVICSTLVGAGTASAMAALDRGAIEIICKPTLGTRQFLEDARVTLTQTIRAAARVPRERLRARDPHLGAPKLTADAIIAKGSGRAMLQTTERVVSVGASTGGTDALVTFLAALPVDAPGVLVVQHMPEQFTRQFAARLDGLCRIHVKEAETGDSVLRGQALIAPGGHHMLLQRSGARYFVQVKDGPLVARHRPSVDVLFRSTARYAGRNGIGVIMTGMGDDGARGMLEMKTAGAHTIAQDEATSVVFGMPHEAIKLGGVAEIMPLDAIARGVMRAAA